MKLFATFGYDESDKRAVLVKDPSSDRAAHVAFIKDALATGNSTHPILRIIDIKGGAIKKRRIRRKTAAEVAGVAGGAPIETPKRKRGRPRKNPEPQLS